MEQFTPEQQKDLKVLVKFVLVYCEARHLEQAEVALPGDLAGMFRKGIFLCADCRALLDHAFLKRRKCPLEPKPSCKKCRNHCYGRDYRARIREIMAFSGKRMILRGRLDYLWHYFF